jgi:hypothetical protein
MTLNNQGSIIDRDSAATLISQDILNVINRLSNQRKIDANLTYSKFNNITIHLHVRRGHVSPTSSNWFKINFEKYGFSIDASTYLGNESEPTIDLKIVIDPLSEDIALSNLAPFLIDAIRHEIEHSQSPNTGPSQSKSSYRYFLSSSEVPAQVAGLSLLARKKGISLSQAIMDYLQPFIESNFMNDLQAGEVLSVWLDYASRN